MRLTFFRDQWTAVQETLAIRNFLAQFLIDDDETCFLTEPYANLVNLTPVLFWKFIFKGDNIIFYEFLKI